VMGVRETFAHEIDVRRADVAKRDQY
jgi:hypothetical protein